MSNNRLNNKFSRVLNLAAKLSRGGTTKKVIMEIILFAIINVFYLFGKKTTAIQEPETIQSLDFQALRNVYNATKQSLRQTPARRESQLAQAAS